MGRGEWTVEQSVLVGHNGTNWTTNPEKAASWFRSEKECGDFILEIEYAINTSGKSGISFVWLWTKIRPTLDTKCKSSLIMAPRPATIRRSLYDVVAPTKNMSPPGME